MTSEGEGGGSSHLPTPTPTPTSSSNRPPSGKAGAAGAAAGGGHHHQPHQTQQQLPPTAPSATLTLVSDALGTFTYSVALKAYAPSPEPSLHFSAPLGTRTPSTFHFKHVEARSSTYTITLSPPDVFTTPTPTLHLPAPDLHSPTGWGGTPGAVEVWYEGVGVGDVEGTLTLKSDGGGVYEVPLRGKSVPPVAVGPLSVAAGGGVDLVFKNPFLEDAEFLLASDTPTLFVVSPPGGVIKVGKKAELKVGVKFTGAANASGRVTMRLVKGGGGGAKAEGAQWVWYLQGTGAPKK